jgi:hypothetical protein
MLERLPRRDLEQARELDRILAEHEKNLAALTGPAH